jgi:outer membrane receptor protein involved in Fe transport
LFQEQNHNRLLKTYQLYTDNKLDDVVLFNTGFRWDKLWKDFFLDARVYNLLDEDYYQGGSVTHPYPQAGRWFMLTVGYKGNW